AKLVLIVGSCPPLRKSKFEYYAVHHFFGYPSHLTPTTTTITMFEDDDDRYPRLEDEDAPQCR
ncbi:hypothetical protein BDZ89DRAFT_950845, partial [Hymenopellis radicata]